MRSVGAFEAKTHLAALVDALPAQRLVPATAEPSSSVAHATLTP